MSLLSDTQGRPHTVRAVIQTMKLLGGKLPDDEVVRWFLPGPFQGEDAEKAKSRVSQTLGCARSLGWVETDRRVHRLINLEIPTTPDAFLDHLHATLCATDKVEDRRVLEAYSVVVIHMEEERTTDWLKDWTAPRLADFIDLAIRGGEEGPRTFNTTKLTAWPEWLEGIGLAWNSKSERSLKQFLPDPMPRLQRELPHLGAELGFDRELSPYEFLRALGRRMPYLDGGAILQDISERMKRPLPQDRVTLVLARALRELGEDGGLTLVSRGDAATRVLQIPAVGVWPALPLVGVVIHEENVR
jgi:hypothetical protein